MYNNRTCSDMKRLCIRVEVSSGFLFMDSAVKGSHIYLLYFLLLMGNISILVNYEKSQDGGRLSGGNLIQLNCPGILKGKN